MSPDCKVIILPRDEIDKANKDKKKHYPSNFQVSKKEGKKGRKRWRVSGREWVGGEWSCRDRCVIFLWMDATGLLCCGIWSVYGNGESYSLVILELQLESRTRYGWEVQHYSKLIFIHCAYLTCAYVCACVGSYRVIGGS